MVAILDTGVDRAHPFLAGRVIEETSYSGNGNCPNGTTTQAGTGAATPCTYAPSGCRHGTHVAGIAAGAHGTFSGTPFSGVAKGASVLAIQVFSRFTGANCSGAGEDPCALAYTSDIVAGMQPVYDLRNQYRIAAVNLSLGGGLYSSQTQCGSDNAAEKAMIDTLRAAGIATVVAAGRRVRHQTHGAGVHLQRHQRRVHDQERYDLLLLQFRLLPVIAGPGIVDLFVGARRRLRHLLRHLHGHASRDGSVGHPQGAEPWSQRGPGAERPDHCGGAHH
jgi:hypothetical protein